MTSLVVTLPRGWSKQSGIFRPGLFLTMSGVYLSQMGRSSALSCRASMSIRRSDCTMCLLTFCGIDSNAPTAHLTATFSICRLLRRQIPLERPNGHNFLPSRKAA